MNYIWVHQFIINNSVKFFLKTLSVTLSPESPLGKGSCNSYNKTPSPSPIKSGLRMTQAGSKQYSVVWNGTDENKNKVSSRLYFIKVKSRNIILTKKVMAIK